MENSQPPHIEVMSSLPLGSTHPQPETVWYKARRFRIFLISFLAFSLISLIYVFQRPAIFQSKSTLLTVTPKAIDQPSQEANIQHVFIQGNILTGQKLIEATREKLIMLTSKEVPTAAKLHDMLFVTAIPDTNLVELKAESSDAHFLPLLLNALTEQYQHYRRQQIKKETDSTALALNEQFNRLTQKVSQKRDELDRFRNEHSILSMGRDENQVLARLKGLTDSLNKASDAEVNAKARLNAVQASIRKGQPIVPNSDKRSLANLEKRAQELRERLSELDRRFTREYLALQPSLRVIPEQLKEIEKKIGHMKNEGQSIVMSETEQAYYAARQASAELRQQIEDYKQTATSFTRHFTEHEALIEELSQLELLYREAQERLIQIEVQQRKKYPQVEVVEPAYLSDQPIRPDYTRDSGIALLLSFFLGLATIWLFEFLKHNEKPPQASTASWSKIFSNHQPISLIEAETPRQLDNAPQPAIESYITPILRNFDLEQLVAATNNQGKRAISALLCGLTLNELASLTDDHIDQNKLKLTVTGTNSRVIPLSKTLAKQLHGQPSSTSEAEALISCAAFDSGLVNPAAINATSIRHAYIVYLVRQGLRLSELENTIGSISAEELVKYTSVSPEGPGKGTDEVNLIYPLGA